MRKIVQFTTSGLIAALMFVSVVVPNVHAATETETTATESITLSPVNKRYQIDAGTLKTDTMTIVNDGKLAYDFILYARPYSIKDEAYMIPDFTSTASNADAYRWMQFEQTKYHIEPGQTLEVGYTMRVPDDAAPGGHYGVLFAETQPIGGGEGSVVARKKRVGMVIYATVKGEYKTAGKHLGAQIPFWQFRAPLTASVRVQNDGNSDFFAKTTYTVKDLFGATKYNETKENPVLPQTKRQIPLEWKSAPWFGLYNVGVTSSYLDQEHTSSGYVLLAPRWLLIVLAITIAGGVIYGVLRRKR